MNGINEFSDYSLEKNQNTHNVNRTVMDISQFTHWMETSQNFKDTHITLQHIDEYLHFLKINLFLHGKTIKRKKRSLLQFYLFLQSKSNDDPLSKIMEYISSDE
ncbi:hypothetical protein IIU_06638 [Bacillus cereus VD133]|uniref:Uncharacterized protein n=1 Tax=Bacillus cereus VD133 TaxID=1053233 RepID=A0A9W5PJW0_BACCE|nr:hypothetical protein [Bacillus cereus]EOO24699.1 hypothetical protein IIU_06638 [Bacillus cereus VD133]